ncbi:MAG: ATP-binding protein [Deferribacteres bacterium]|nr:ATP-binding protein [Deferribacteres bacterium]
MTKYVQRDISKIVLEALHEMPVVVITGMRQTGKSTFLQMQRELGKRRYITFDDFEYLEAAKTDPDGLLEPDHPVTIDEAQRCPEILTAIKKRVDRKRKKGQFLLSGSANFAILKGISESLAGRAIYLTLHPFTRRELSGRISGKPFLKRFLEKQEIREGQYLPPVKPKEILQGGMPTVCLGDVKNAFLWFKGYEQTYLERDIRELSQIANIISFRHLLHLIALRTGQLLSPSQLGRDAKMNTATTSRYLSLLEASFIIYRLNPYLRNRASRLIKSPKVYLSDSGLACYLASVKDLEPATREPLRGALFETYIAQNLSGIIDSTWPEARLYFWNIQGRHEVDFIVEAGSKCIAIEVKAASRWEKRDISGLNAFLSTTPHCKAGILAYNGNKTVRIGERLWAVPLSLVLS